MIRWKFVAAVAILAMAVSLLSGGLGGIGFGVLIFRAFLGAVVFTGLAVGLNLFVVRVFPELLENDDFSDSGVDAAMDTPGARVDIVMPAEAPDSFAGADEAEVVNGEAGGSETGDSQEPDDVEADGLEALGDLDGFAGSFSEDGSDKPDSSPPKKTNNALGDNQEPEELAQAIQTVMKRDEKG